MIDHTTAQLGDLLVLYLWNKKSPQYRVIIELREYFDERRFQGCCVVPDSRGECFKAEKFDCAYEYIDVVESEILQREGLSKFKEIINILDI